MDTAALPNTSTFELPLSGKGPAVSVMETKTDFIALPETLLVRNVRWFCRLRWSVVVALGTFGALGFFPQLCARMGFHARTSWALVAAGVLTIANVVFLVHARKLAGSDRAGNARLNLWSQIVLDLAVLTVVVHFTGSLETYVASAYLFHIVLSCIFFSPAASLAVTVLASALYATCVAAETLGLVPSAGIYADGGLRAYIERTPGLIVFEVISAVAFWLVIWFLSSHLAGRLRRREQQLGRMNRQLVDAQLERSRHMLRTTHELKAPFAAIRANVQLLLEGYCGVVSEEALEILQRIAARCRRLGEEIKEMLQLANLRSDVTRSSQCWMEVNSKELLLWAIEQIQQIAHEHKVTIEADLEAFSIVGIEDHMKMLFMNLIANAVTYSHAGDTVRVRCRQEAGHGATLVIEDQGIGIPPEKLPKIFDEYYRTDEAARHNKDSTGLGLAIVRHIAEDHGIRVRVESAQDVGTKFTLGFPPGAAPQSPAHA